MVRTYFRSRIMTKFNLLFKLNKKTNIFFIFKKHINLYMHAKFDPLPYDQHFATTVH